MKADFIYSLNQYVRGQYKVIAGFHVCLLSREEDKNQSWWVSRVLLLHFFHCSLNNQADFMTPTRGNGNSEREK